MKQKKYWRNKKVLITGASFIGSHLIDSLIKLDADIRVVNLTEKHLPLFKKYVPKRVEFIKRDLRNLELAKKSVKDRDIVFHLASDHGGRGYIDLNQGNISSNFLLDSSVFFACLKENIEKVIYASSGCVYPNYLQTDPDKILYLKEEMVKNPYDADGMYGWAKLMGEKTLKSYYKDFGLKSVNLRYFSVFGERGMESHAVIAMIAKAFIKQDPFEIWGTGHQIRNWTYIKDIIEGTLLAAERIENADSINIGTMERVRVIDAVKLVFSYTDHKAKIKLLKNMPTGPYNRVADNTKAKKLLGWKPKVKFKQGFFKTIDWYFTSKNSKFIKKNIKKLLLKR